MLECHASLIPHRLINPRYTGFLLRVSVGHPGPYGCDPGRLVAVEGRSHRKRCLRSTCAIILSPLVRPPLVMVFINLLVPLSFSTFSLCITVLKNNDNNIIVYGSCPEGLFLFRSKSRKNLTRLISLHSLIYF